MQERGNVTASVTVGAPLTAAVVNPFRQRETQTRETPAGVTLTRRLRYFFSYARERRGRGKDGAVQEVMESGVPGQPVTKGGSPTLSTTC